MSLTRGLLWVNHMLRSTLLHPPDPKFPLTLQIEDVGMQGWAESILWLVEIFPLQIPVQGLVGRECGGVLHTNSRELCGVWGICICLTNTLTPPCIVRFCSGGCGGIMSTRPPHPRTGGWRGMCIYLTDTPTWPSPWSPHCEFHHRNMWGVGRSDWARKHQMAIAWCEGAGMAHTYPCTVGLSADTSRPNFLRYNSQWGGGGLSSCRLLR